MNWLEKISYSWNPSDIINGVLTNQYDGSKGGWAYQQLQQIGPVPEVCQQINYAAGVNPAARAKMRVLAEASGCQWAPENPPQTNIDNVEPQQMPMPVIGDQENSKTPSVEIGN